jgi:regulator of replication initiation timing
MMKSSWEQVQLNEDRLLKEQIREEMQELQQENTQLKAELQALRELLKEVEFNWDAACNICHKTMKHEPGCRMKAELDKIGGGE